MPQTRSSTRNSRETASPDDHLESLTVHGAPATPDPNDCLPTKGPEVEAKPGDISSWGSTETQGIIDWACIKQVANLKETNATENMIDVSVRNLRTYLTAIGPELYSAGTVQEKFLELQYQIHSFVAEFSSVTWARLSPDEQSKVKAWAPKAEQLMESRRGRKALFEAWVWHILDDNIFSANPSTKWQAVKDTTMPWHLVGQLMEIFQNSDFKYFDGRAHKFYIWSALSAELARDSCQCSQTMPTGYTAQLIRNELGHLMGPTNPQLELELELIEANSGCLDMDLMIGRFKTSLRWDNGIQLAGFPYSATSSEYDPSQPGMVVDDLFIDDFKETVDPPKREPALSGQPVELVIVPALGVHGQTSWIGPSSMVGDPNKFSWISSMTVVAGELPGSGRRRVGAAPGIKV